MKARASTIVTSPNSAFDKKIDPMTGRVFVDTLGNVVSSALGAVADKVMAVVRFTSKAVIDAAVAAGTLAHHEIRILSPDTKVLSDVNGQHPTGSTPFNSKRHILVPLTSTSRAKVWGVAGKSYVVTTPDGVPDGDVCMALFNGSILPSASPMNVSQLIQVVGDTIEANRSLATPASVGEVYIVVSQNDAKALLIEEPNGAGADADANFAAFITSIALPEIAKITVAANDLPVSTTGANFGE